jgi:uncharacterized protein YodC (DUF2158 family)
MAYSAGSIVVLKSGGQAMTVISSTDDEVEVIWHSDIGELFRQAIPVVVLDLLPNDDEDEEIEEEDDQDDEEGDTTAGDDEPNKKKKKEYAD